MGLVRGFLGPFRGGAFIARRGLWHYLVLPVLLDLALGVATLFLASRYWRGEGFVGEQLIKAVHERHPDTQILICSAYVQEPSLRRLLHEGTYPILPKPFAPVEGRPGERPRIWPIVQLSDWGEPVPATQVADVIGQGTRLPAIGVTAFAWGPLSKDRDKVERLGRAYRSLRP